LTEQAETVERRDAAGALVERSMWRGGALHGTTTTFDPNGQALLEIGFADGLREGPMAVHGADGALLATMHYRAGQLDGPMQLHERGRRLSELSYVAGIAEGPCRTYGPAGAVASEGTMRQGRPHGVWTIRRPDGSVQQSLTYADGVLEGEACDLDAAGVVRRRAAYRGGRLDGEVVEYNAAGQVTKRTTYVAGREVAPPPIARSPKPWWRKPFGGSVDSLR
jgi:antitoxin component YwqK of YwqJK toxin-antitoxin module